MYIILTILAELFFVTFLILLLYRLKPRIGLAPLFVLLGSFQYFQTILYKSTFITIFGDYYVSPSGIILFCSGLFAILLIYIKEGVRTAQNLIWGIVLANLAFTVLTVIIGLEGSTMKDIIYSQGIDPNSFTINFRLFTVGTFTLILDSLIIVVLYELFFVKTKWLNQFGRLVTTMLIVFNFDAVVFAAGSFWGSENLHTIIISQMMGKTIAALFFGSSLFIYLRFFDKSKNDFGQPVKKGNQDILSIITYKERYERLQNEKATSDEHFQSIIDEKTVEQEKALRRHTIMASVRELRIDKFSTADQAKEFLIKLKEAFEVDACTIHLIKNEELKLLTSVGITENGMAYKEVLTFPYLKALIRKKQNLFIEDTSKDPLFKADPLDENNVFKYISCAGAPLFTGEKVIGLLKLYSVLTMRRFTYSEMEHLQVLSSQVAYAIEANQLFAQNEKHKEILVKQIYARKKVENANKESEIKYRTLVDRVSDAFVSLDENWVYTFVNKKAGEIFNRAPEELVGKHIWTEFPEGIGQPFQLAYEKAMRTQEKIILLQYYPPYDKWFENNIYPSPQGLSIYFKDVTDRKKAQDQIEDYNSQLRKLTAHLQSIREEERRRIGREIHDDLGQQLTAIKMDAAWIDRQIPADEKKIKGKLSNIIGLLNDSNQAVRRILSELKPSILDEYGLLDAMNIHAIQFTENTGIPVIMEADKQKIKLPTDIATCLFRVFQESLTNITRYAKAKNVISSIQMSDNMITLIVKDDGDGFDPSVILTKGSFGLLGMQERVSALEGRFHIDSKIGEGTSVIVEIPYNRNL